MGPLSIGATVALVLLAAGVPPAAFQHAERLYVLAFAPDGEWLAGAGAGTIRLWRTSNGATIRTIATDEPLPRGLFSTPDGRLLVLTADRELTTWDVRSGRRRSKLPITNVQGLSADGRFILAGRPLQVWELGTGRRVYAATAGGDEPGEAGPDQPLDPLCPSASGLAPDGRRGFSLSGDSKGMVGGGDNLGPRCDCTLSVWRLQDPRWQKSLKLERCPWRAPRFDDVGRRLVVGLEQAVLVWDVDTPDSKPLRVPVPGSPARWGQLAAARSRLLLRGDDWIGVWDLAGGRSLWRQQQPSGSVPRFRVALPPGGQHVIAIDWDRVNGISVWEAASGRLVVDAMGGFSITGLRAVAYEPCGRGIAYLDGVGTLVWRPFPPSDPAGR